MTVKRIELFFEKNSYTFTYLFFLIFSLFMAQFPRIFIPEEVEVNNWHLFVFGIGIFIAMISLMELTPKNSFFDKHKVLNVWWKYPFKILYFLTILVGTILLVATSVNPHGENVNTANLEVMIKLSYYLLAYNIFCLLFIFFRYKVKKDHIVTLNNKIYYPEEKYIKWPTINYNDKVTCSSIALEFDEKWECKDVSKKFFMTTVIGLDIDKAKEEKIEKFDYDSFIKNVKLVIKQEIEERARNLTCIEFIEGDLYGGKDKEFYVNGFPIKWNGSVLIQHINKNLLLNLMKG